MTFSACRKEVDFAKDEVAANTALAGQPTYCRIESIWQNPFASDQRFILILCDGDHEYSAVPDPLATVIMIEFPDHEKLSALITVMCLNAGGKYFFDDRKN